MAGICAVLGPDANIHIKRICDSLKHRGPDDEGYYFNENVALGHRALKLGTVSLIHQPLANEDGTIWITFDGEIYNKGQLIEQLKKNHTFKTYSSAEVVVHAYKEDGVNCVSRFNGIFSFCLWDSNKRTLFVARDRHGSKPLYYCNTRNLFLVSSEIKGLLAIASVPRKPNDGKIYDYLMGESHNPDETFFMGIKSLLAGHYLLVDKESTIAHQYWNPEKAHRVREDKDYISEFRELFRDSVKIRLPPDLPFATFLSGGIDSPSVAVIINDILKQTSENTRNSQSQKFFSAVYEDALEQGDERPYIEEVLNTLGAKTNYVFPSVTGRWTDIKHFIYIIDEPVLVLNYYVFWCLSREASKKVHVAFYGMTGRAIGGGIDTISLYARFLKQLLRKKRIDRLIAESIGILPRFNINSILKIKAIVRRNEEARITRLLDPRFVARFSNRKQENPVSLDSDYLLFRDSLADHLRVCDRVSSAFSIEPRYPFLDHRVTEFFLDLPTEQKVRNGLTKYVVRSTMKGLLPEAVRKTRKKFGTPIPTERWMKELRKNIKQVFESEKFREREYFNQVAVSDLFDRCCDMKIGRADRQYYLGVLWRILNVELWFEIFFDQQSGYGHVYSAGLKNARVREKQG